MGSIFLLIDFSMKCWNSLQVFCRDGIMMLLTVTKFYQCWFPETNRTIKIENLWLIGRFHTRGRTNRLDGQIISDEQIVSCENGTNKFFDEQIVWYLAVWKDDFSQTICLSRRTSRRQYDINSNQTDKCQMICLSRWFVRPLMWKRPLNLLPASCFQQRRQNIPLPSKYESDQIPLLEQNEMTPR